MDFPMTLHDFISKWRKVELNERPAWLANAHARLDAAVAAAYGWPADLPDAEILERLLALNQAAAG